MLSSVNEMKKTAQSTAEIKASMLSAADSMTLLWKCLITYNIPGHSNYNGSNVEQSVTKG